jgi:hypothetical protein
MDHHYLLYPDYDPKFHSNQLDQIYRDWTRHDRDRLRCTPEQAYFLGIREDEGDIFDALVLSETLVEKIQHALCIAHSYWTIPEKVAAEEKVRFENEARTQAWEEELEHLIGVTKKKVKRTGRATDKERDTLQKLLEEWKKCEKTKKYYQYHRQKHENRIKLGRERWINAWFAVQQELDRLWVRDGQIKKYRPKQPPRGHTSVSRRGEPRGRSRSRERRQRNSSRGHRRESGSRNADRRSDTGSRSRRQARDSRHRERGSQTQGHLQQERSSRGSRGRSRSSFQSRSSSQSRSLSQTRGRKRDHYELHRYQHLGPKNKLYRQVALSPIRSDSDGLWRMAGSNLDSEEMTQGFLAHIAKPAHYRRELEACRDGYVSIAEHGVTPAASTTDEVEQPDGTVSILSSADVTANNAIPPTASILQQAQYFENGLRELALEFDNRDMPSPKPTEPSEQHSSRSSGNKRKRENENENSSQRKLPKLVASQSGASKSRTPQTPAIEWFHGRSCVQALDARTPYTPQKSIRDFSKPGQSSDVSLCQP